MYYVIQGRCLEGAFWFACLLNFKHIFAYVAPAYFVFLLKHYCFKHRDPEGHVKQPSDVLSAPSLLNFDVRRFIKLGVLVISIFLLSFGPFIYMVRSAVFTCVMLALSQIKFSPFCTFCENLWPKICG